MDVASASRMAVLTASEYVELGIPEVADVELLAWGVLYFSGRGMTDKEIKDQIDSALASLNAALRKAASAGLTVNLHNLDVTTFADETKVQLITAEITRVTQV